LRTAQLLSLWLVQVHQQVKAQVKAQVKMQVYWRKTNQQSSVQIPCIQTQSKPQVQCCEAEVSCRTLLYQ
jgi:hypothetical protein